MRVLHTWRDDLEALRLCSDGFDPDPWVEGLEDEDSGRWVDVTEDSSAQLAAELARLTAWHEPPEMPEPDTPLWLRTLDEVEPYGLGRHDGVSFFIRFASVWLRLRDAEVIRWQYAVLPAEGE